MFCVRVCVWISLYKDAVHRPSESANFVDKAWNWGTFFCRDAGGNYVTPIYLNPRRFRICEVKLGSHGIVLRCIANPHVWPHWQDMLFAYFFEKRKKIVHQMISVCQEQVSFTNKCRSDKPERKRVYQERFTWALKVIRSFYFCYFSFIHGVFFLYVKQKSHSTLVCVCCLWRV